eukprot:TRINITY_DN21001_c0_g1_i2.p1 TRINITY_DN21001_c0_g1~~TRINITY_DN21001_c0_g1_i2.p1  ORF type:complete len:735 (+),score=172.71 TRINITY_DN21001_c0_g1_i2:209-2206(+)
MLAPVMGLRSCLAWLSGSVVVLSKAAAASGVDADDAVDPELASEARALACALHRPEWRRYQEAFEAAARATASADEGERSEALVALAESLAERTSNVSDVLSCNVGVIAGYYLAARLASPLAVDSMGLAGGPSGLAYRLLQLALIFIFTLRNANRIPAGPGVAWGISERSIIPAIMQMRRTKDTEVHRALRGLRPIAPGFRDRSLRIGVVSICAYPEGHPLDLPRLTPENRDTYTNRHDYALRLHMEPPILGAHGLGLQHAKLATVLAYLQTNEFDWLAWFDCDSIIMNMDRTLDSIIYQYAQRQPEDGADEDGKVCGEPADEEDKMDAVGAAMDLAGTWHDSWIPEELRDEAAIELDQRPDGSLQTSGVQIGEASGRVAGDNGDEVTVDFPEGGPLHGRVVVDDESAEMRLEWENGAVWVRARAAAAPPAAQASQAAAEPKATSCREPCRALGSAACAGLELDPEVNLLITEEGWGLSSANWLVRNSAWSRQFLHDALNAAHAELNLFGDQDGMILHLMNKQALDAAAATARAGAAAAATAARDPLDRHAAVIPQFELNAYDALNALTMDCDCFVEGDLLITFPQCKDAEGCNDVFNLAADFAKDAEKPTDADAGAWWLRRELAPRWPRYTARSSPALRVFGPRPVIREVFLRQRGQDSEESED